jgi:hypothetical protein
MFSAISAELARERELELRQIERDGRLARLLRLRRPAIAAPVESNVTIRAAAECDREALRRLAELDSRPVPAGFVLVAEVGDELRAALPVAGGEAVADPFHPTAALTSLLELRARQLRDGRPERPAPARHRGLVAVPHR